MLLITLYMTSLKLQKLTENCSKSQAYGKKVEQEVANIGEAILQTRLAMAKLQQQIQDILAQSKRLQCGLKKQQQQASNYDYKMQRLEIRLQQYTRKVEIQQKMLYKKLNHREQLEIKIQEFQTHLKHQSVIDGEIQNAKQGIKIIDKKLTAQNQQIEAMCTAQFTYNKNLRAKEDEVSRKLKANQKKRAMLADLNKQLTGEDDEKQNEPFNRIQSGEQSKVRVLVRNRQIVNKKLQDGIQELMQIYKQLQNLNQNGLQVKKSLQQTQQIINESKIKKSSLMKLAQMLKLQAEGKQN